MDGENGGEQSMPESAEHTYVGRGGVKLAAALAAWGIEPAAWVCADFGSNVGGFVDCLLRRGAARVYAIDTGYGALAYTLRKDPRVVVMERTNAMHVRLPEPLDLVSIDVGWTPQHQILPNALRLLRPGGRIITLIKPHYEADRRYLREGVLAPAYLEETMQAVRRRVGVLGIEIARLIPSPLAGRKGNVEYLALILKSP